MIFDNNGFIMGIPTDTRLFPSDKHRAYDEMDEIFNTIGHKRKDGSMSTTQSIDMQVTEQCNLRCTYCFQFNKSNNRLKIEDAKKFIDYLLSRTPENCSYTNPDKYHAIVLGFVGGDALLEIDMIDELITYFVQKMVDLQHPWLDSWAIHLDTNGVLYFSDKVQKVLKKWPNTVNCTITLDGSKELHDKCRIFPDGSGSYDMAVAAIDDQFKKGNEPAGKFTIAHENIEYMYESIKHMIDLGYTLLLGNTVFEDVWQDGDARRFYDQLIKIADYLIEKELYKSIYFPLLEPEHYVASNKEIACQNQCGGNGRMLNLSTDGKLYNCYRYNRTAVAPKRKPLSIGDVNHGIGFTDEEKENILVMQSISRKTCSDDECNNCPIGSMCGYCNGCNYYMTGSPNIRTKFHCLFHCASSLAAAYYWNTIQIKNGNPNRWPVKCYKHKALQILSKDEYDKLVDYCKEVE